MKKMLQNFGIVKVNFQMKKMLQNFGSILSILFAIWQHFVIVWQNTSFTMHRLSPCYGLWLAYCIAEMGGLWKFSVWVQSWSEEIESDPVLICKIFENHQSNPVLIRPCKK